MKYLFQNSICIRQTWLDDYPVSSSNHFEFGVFENTIKLIKFPGRYALVCPSSFFFGLGGCLFDIEIEKLPFRCIVLSHAVMILVRFILTYSNMVSGYTHSGRNNDVFSCKQSIITSLWLARMIPDLFYFMPKISYLIKFIIWRA